jgi:hypothetical protein
VPAQPLLHATSLVDEIVAMVDQQLDLDVDLLAFAWAWKVRLAQRSSRDRQRVNRVRLPALSSGRHSGTVSFGGTRASCSSSPSSCR